MTPFAYARPGSPADAVAAVLADPQAHFIAGGSNLLDLWKEGVVQPSRVVDVTRLPGLDGIEDYDGGMRIGALARNSHVADDARVRGRYPLLAQALLAASSPQLRNAATMGGNVLQRTRCPYFTDRSMACNKRQPGAGCSALAGWSHIHAILGASLNCIATYPGDMAVALVALDASLQIQGADGVRLVPLEGFHRLPGDRPDLDTELEHGELILSVDLPAPRFGGHVSYFKVRERSSYAFASVAVAAALRVEGGVVAEARIVLGSVAHRPWRAAEAEAALVGRPAGREAYKAAAAAAVAGAAAVPGTAYKIALARRAIPRALEQAAAGRPTFAVSS